MSIDWLNKLRTSPLSPDDPIGVFDSGVGGLTVLSEIRRVLPGESVIYFGDTARVPYGPKSRAVISRYTKEISSFLIQRGVKMLVIACNTSTAVMGRELMETLTIPVLGVIEPACRLAATVTVSGRIGIIGTRGTVKSRAYLNRLQELDPRFEVLQKACPLYVPMAEEGWIQGVVPREVTRSYLKGMKEKKIDTLILGCTHYPILRPAIEEYMGPGVNIIDSATQTALAVKARLTDLDLTADGGRGNYEFCCSDSPALFREVGNRFLDFEITEASRVKVWEFGQGNVKKNKK